MIHLFWNMMLRTLANSLRRFGWASRFRRQCSPAHTSTTDKMNKYWPRKKYGALLSGQPTYYCLFLSFEVSFLMVLAMRQHFPVRWISVLSIHFFFIPKLLAVERTTSLLHDGRPCLPLCSMIKTPRKYRTFLRHLITQNYADDRKFLVTESGHSPIVTKLSQWTWLCGS